ncbi:MAG: low-complexity tail membrane protein, partial [Prochlorococcus sp.]
MTARSEPLLWLQLLSIGFIPLELILLRLVLAGSDPGPVPSLERVFIWTVAVLAPSIALWRRPADWGSMLLISLPGRGRSTSQRKLSGLQNDVFNRLGLVTGSIALLLGLWWLDQSSVLVHDFSPLQGSSRLIVMLTCIPLLALLLWQWHQLGQALWLLSRSDQALSEASEVLAEDLPQQRICLGLGLLQLKELELPASASPSSPVEDDPLAQGISQEPSSQEEGKQDSEQDANADPDVDPELEAEAEAEAEDDLTSDAGLADQESPESLVARDESVSE